MATAQHEMETATDEEAEAARRRAMPQGQRDESEASATMAAAAAVGRSSRSLGPVRPTHRDKKAVAVPVIFTKTNRRAGGAELCEAGRQTCLEPCRSRFGLGPKYLFHFFTRFFFSNLR